VKVIRNKDKGKREAKCKCYICGDPSHFAKECPRRKGDLNMVNFVDNLQLPDEWDVVSVEQDELDSDHICCMSEHEAGPGEEPTALTAAALPYDENLDKALVNWAFPVIRLPRAPDPKHPRVPEWMATHPLSPEQEACDHQWDERGYLPELRRFCSYCHNGVHWKKRIICDTCQVIVCTLCARIRLGLGRFPAYPYGYDDGSYRHLT